MPQKRKSHPPQSSRAEKSEKPVVVGDRVRELCKARGWTQQELAWYANLSVPKVNRVMREKQGIGAAALLRLVVALNTSADYLLGLTEDKKPRAS